MNYKHLIDLLEDEDRIIASSILTDLLKRNEFTDIKCTGTPITCSVDLWCSCAKNKDYKFNVEIKKNNKDERQLKAFPHSLLKVAKLLNMLKASENTSLYYMVLENEETAYIYNIRKLDFSKIELKYIKEKRTLVNPNSDWIKVLVYRIPYEMACKKINIKQYYADYKQTLEKEKMDLEAQ